MSEADKPPSGAAGQAAADLAQVQAKVESARVLLARLLQEVVVAESLLRGSQAARLLAANEQLVLTSLRNQTEAETAAKVLAKLAHAAEVDPLTQLPNRAVMLDRLAQAIAAAQRHERRLAVLFLDLNNFKRVNDGLGHGVGDEVLKLMAHRLVATLRVGDTVSRHGGDEFVVLLTEIAEPADAARVADDLAIALAAPSRIGDQVLRLTASVGIAIYPDDGKDVETLLERADAAMFTAKRRGMGSTAFYDAQEASQGAAHAAPATTAVSALSDPLSHHGAAVEGQQQRYAELRDANEQLVLAALNAQDLQASAERAHRRQSEFMTLVADELSNPLGPIRLAASMLGQVQSAEPLLPRAQSIIEKQVENMSRLVSAMQDVSHAGKSALHLDRELVDLVEVVDAAVASCRPSMDARLQAFTIRLPDAPVPVMGEQARLEQLVRNLLDNASQYTPDLGHIQLVLAVHGPTVELTVSDSGIGITALALPTIFEPFVQDIPAIGFRTAGLGIGLTVVQTLAEAHGGTVVARSAGTGQGSQFTVTLPLAAEIGKP